MLDQKVKVSDRKVFEAKKRERERERLQKKKMNDHHWIAKEKICNIIFYSSNKMIYLSDSEKFRFADCIGKKILNNKQSLRDVNKMYQIEKKELESNQKFYRKII